MACENHYFYRNPFLLKKKVSIYLQFIHFLFIFANEKETIRCEDLKL